MFIPEYEWTQLTTVTLHISGSIKSIINQFNVSKTSLACLHNIVVKMMRMADVQNVTWIVP